MANYPVDRFVGGYWEDLQSKSPSVLIVDLGLISGSVCFGTSVEYRSFLRRIVTPSIVHIFTSPRPGTFPGLLGRHAGMLVTLPHNKLLRPSFELSVLGF